MDRTKEIVVLGSGFAGLWAALGAARHLDELGIAAETVGVTVISSRPFHDIRVRNYEADLTPSRIGLGDILRPAGVSHIAADVTAINPATRTVTYSGGSQTYDRLVVALGSQVVKPNLGSAGAVYTEGWDRHVVARGQQAKATKRTINTQRIYPPLNGNRDAILSAAAPVLQGRPDRAAG